MPTCLLSTTQIRAIFSEEISDADGSVSDVFDDGDRLFARAILPKLSEVRPGDQMQGGVALKATGCDVSINPYLFRLECRNGMIRAQSIQTRRIEISDFFAPEEASAAVRESVRACCVEEAFVQGVQQVRSTVDVSVDIALQILPVLSHLDPKTGARLFREIVFRFKEDPKRSGFALMNAVTSVARDTRDPELRLRLEELGGGIPARLIPTPTLDPATTHLSADAPAEESWAFATEQSQSPKLLDVSR